MARRRPRMLAPGLWTLHSGLWTLDSPIGRFGDHRQPRRPSSTGVRERTIDQVARHVPDARGWVVEQDVCPAIPIEVAEVELPAEHPLVRPHVREVPGPIANHLEPPACVR